jgi:phospholipid/cholesterol/gamma-HCH transport system substrate-binding protein
VTIARAAALAALACAGVLVAVLLLDGGARTRYELRFQNAGQLVVGNDVRVGGRSIGRVAEIDLTADSQAAVTVEIDEAFGPLRRGTRAAIRATSLSGIAGRFVVIAPGPDNARALADGDVIEATATTDVVELDQLFATFDARARRGLQRIIRGGAAQFDGRGPEANQAAEYFNPALSSTRRLVREVNRDSETLSRFLVDTARAMTALASRRETLTDLVGNANEAAEGVVAENEALSASLARLPTTLRRGNSTFVNLRSTLDDLDELVAESRPATRRLAEFLRELRPLVSDARPTIRELRTAIRRPGADNDLVELLGRTPRLADVSGPALRNTTRALDRSGPFLSFFRPYTPELVGWFRGFGQGAANYDANGHYARVQPIFNTFAFTESPEGGLLTPQSPDDRLDGLQTGLLRRCPGAATPAPADGSAPFTDGSELDCDARLTVPGP